MAVQNTREDLSKSKKRRAVLDEKFIESTLGSLEGLQMAMESVDLPETLGQFPVKEEPKEETPKVDDDITKWTQEQPKTFFQRLQDPEKPKYNQERADKLKKVQLAKGLSQALGSIGKLALRQNQGIAGENSDTTGQWLTNEINFLEDDYLRQMADYQNNLAKTQQYNNQLANAEKEMLLQEQNRQQDIQIATDRFEKEMANANDQKAKQRALDKYIAELRAKGADADRSLEYTKQFNYGRAQDMQGVEEAREALEIKIKEINALQDSFADQGVINAREKEKNELERKYYQLLEQFYTKAGYDTSKPEPPQKAPSTFNGPYAPEKPFNPADYERSTQIDNAVSEKPVERPDTKVDQKITKAKSFFDSAVEGVIKSGKIHRSQMPELERAAKEAGVDISQDDIREFLEENGVEISFNPKPETIEKIAYPFGKPNRSQLSQR